MSHSVGEHLGLAGTGAGSDQQCRRRYSSAADAVFDGPALFRVEGVQMPTGVDRLQLVVPFPWQVYRAPSQACPGNDINAGSPGFQEAPTRGPASLVVRCFLRRTPT
jgi:hypothetical protein